MAHQNNADNLDELSDEELVLLSGAGNDRAMDYLLEKYRDMVRCKARAYFLVGADREDIIQEGMLGLFKAVRDYKGGMSSFRAFAELCITRQIITAIKTATRKKHAPLNSYISLNRPLADEEYDITLMDIIGREETGNPENILINREKFLDISEKMDTLLSTFEHRVLALYTQGKSYHEIGETLGREAKSIDNALQRIKHKISRYIEKCR